MPATQSRKMFVNLPVKDLDRSVEFFTALGFTFDPRFTDANATCMLVGEDAYVMLLVTDMFTTFTTKEVADATTSTGAIIAVSAGSREEVDELAEAALAAGATPAGDPADHGFMYYRSFHDLDGHHWEVLWMDPAAAAGG